MKKIFLVATLVTLFSCSSDDNNDNNPNNTSIVGEWDYVERNINGVDSGFDELCQFEEYLIFSNDSGFEHIEFDNPTVSSCVQIESTIGNWSINNGIITLTYDFGYTLTAEIIQLNATTLKYKISSQDVNDDDINDNVIYTMSKRN